jgi:hypothetical protein
MATNLQFIKEFNSTASMSSASLTGCFNEEFDVYEIYIRHLSTSSNVSYFYTRFIDSAGNTISDAEYDYAGFDMHCDTTFGERKGTGQTFMETHFVGGVNYQQMGGLALTVFNPYDSSSYTFMKSQGSVQDSLNGNQLMGGKHIGVHKVAEQITGITFSLNTGTLDEGMKFSVYGVK